MRIGVLTHSGSDDNYGQILQCYALQIYLREAGHDVFLIKYSSEADNKSERFHFFKHIVRLFLSVISPARRKAYAEIALYRKLRVINTEKNKQRGFQKFLYDNVVVSPPYHTYEELKTNAPQADAYIVGSDQVWNQDLSKPHTAVWYLQFGEKKMRRISYAASIGRTLKESEIEQFATYLKQFDAVSVRENSALEYCRQVGIVDAQLVLDPTLLISFDKYKSFVTETDEKPYLFLYYLNIDNTASLHWEQLREYLTYKGLKLKSVSSSGYLPAYDLIPEHANLLLTIPEWLTAIYNAECVVTTSFHGIVFSIIMHRPFVAILLNNFYSSGNDRIVSLLKYLGLEERIFTDSHSVEEILSRPINWKNVDNLITSKREESYRFLTEALQ